MSKRLEAIGDVGDERMAEMQLLEFFKNNAVIVAGLMELHGALLPSLSSESRLKFTNSTTNAAAAGEMLHLCGLNPALRQTFETFSGLSTQFRQKQQDAKRQRDPMRKDQLLKTVRFGGELLCVVQDFLGSCGFERELDTILVLTPEDEFELGAKYFPKRFVAISVGRIPGCGAAAPLYSSFASKAELQFSAADSAAGAGAHDISQRFVAF